MTVITEIGTRRFLALASLALRYPERDIVAKVIEASRDIEGLSELQSAAVSTLVTFFNENDSLFIESEYVRIFDNRRKACLYLSYYLNGDTRKRGVALVDFKDSFAREGFTPTDDELPDFLPTLLEFIATTASPYGSDLLIAHKSGLEVLVMALREYQSPYAQLIEAISLLIKDKTPSRTLALIEQGPPTELVGLSGYGQ